ncbi:MAG: sugar ABC transporter ATP-binding protein [Planctomycetota bacterium]
MSDHSLLEMQGICKRFGPTIALENVELEIQAGEVLALIGENGAGKSTLLKTLSGAHRADSGRMTLAGEDFSPSGPADSRKRGIAMIYQELNLAPDLSVEDNVLLGQPGTGGGLLLRSTQRSRVQEALATVGLEGLSPTAIVGKQSVATQQLVEIARALACDAKVILFDEPTSSLPQNDVKRLFEIIKRLKNNGIAIVYISHFLEEVRSVADRYTVLRDGHSVGSGKIADVTDQQIISLMVGRDVDDLFPVAPHTPGEDYVEITNLSGNPYPSPTSFTLRRGEIFGIAGLVGSGRTEVLRCLFGLDTASGTVKKEDQTIRQAVKSRMRQGFGMLSEDRKTEGLAQDLSIVENITISNLRPYTTLGFINLFERSVRAAELMQQVEVKAHSGSQLVSELSGGNQQKVAIARILHQDSDVLLMDEPTKGIDVGTKAEIYRMMGELADKGRTVVFVSSYLPELLAVCDRIGVMARGSLREVRDAADWTQDDILQCAIGIDEGS